MQKSTMMKKEAADLQRKWYVIDATDLILGKLSVKVADILRGKNKPIYTPNVDCGDHVIIINSNKVTFTGNKLDGENTYTHSHYMSGLRTRTKREMVDKYSIELIEKSVKRMLPKNRLSRQIITKLHIYDKSTHNNEAQKPIELKLGDKR